MNRVQGSTKKALIDILDQVENVISVEESVCKDEETFLEAERCPEDFLHISQHRVTLRKVNSDRDVDFHGSNGTNSKNNSNVFNSQSPFNTPPSLSFCHDKAADGFSGVPDEQGSRQHKKGID
ncbi:unnamed protein product [Fraxinus pennsylvanica]|uniref:Uncharacterized protein n=1 Tax=Fraxinus pennsylvanica TaxID=56036 RepID=A0AAD1ZC31_9LAMI|nr:unnamed protein product [Fraxinus pennsylvanica]